MPPIGWSGEPEPQPLRGTEKIQLTPDSMEFKPQSTTNMTINEQAALDGIKGLMDERITLAMTAPPPPSGSPGFIGAKIANSQVQTVQRGDSLTPLQFDTALFDTSGFFNPAQKDRLTIPLGLDGYYLIGGTIAYQVNSQGTRELYFRPNGLTINLASNNLAASPTDPTIITTVALEHLNAGDFVRTHAYHDSSGPLQILSNPGWPSPRFWIHRLG